MKTLFQRLHWALIGYKARPWPESVPVTEPSDPENFVAKYLRDATPEQLKVLDELALLDRLHPHRPLPKKEAYYWETGHNMQPSGMLSGGSEGVPPGSNAYSGVEPAGVLASRFDGTSGVFSGSRRQDVYLRESITLAADLLAPHFQSAISATTRAVFGPQDGGSPSTVYAPTQYVALGGALEEIDVLASSAAWLARRERLDQEATERIFQRAVLDIFHP